MMKINELVKMAHDNAVDKGFYGCYCSECKKYQTCESEYREPAGSCDDNEHSSKNIGELLMLIVSELGEALEAHRKNKHAILSGYETGNEIKQTEYIKMIQRKFFEEDIKDTFEDEIADTFIRLADLCGYLNIDIEKHIELKMHYNETREYKHGKRY